MSLKKMLLTLIYSNILKAQIIRQKSTLFATLNIKYFPTVKNPVLIMVANPCSKFKKKSVVVLDILDNNIHI